MRRFLDGFGELARPKDVSLISATHGVNEFFSIAIPPVIPFLVADLDITYAEAGLLLTAFFVMYSVFQLPAGMVGDRVGKKPVLVGGMVGMAGGIFLASTADTYATLVAAQVVAGIGGSTFHPTGMSLISDFETGTTEGKAMGVFGFGGTLGTAAAPLVVGGVAGLVDWRVALAVAAVLGLVVTVAFAALFTEPDRSSDDGPDGNSPSGSDSDDDPDGAGAAARDGRTEPRGGRPPGDDPDSGAGRSRPSTAADGSSTVDDAVEYDGGRPDAVRRLSRRVADATRVPLTPGVAMLMLLTALLSMQSRAVMTFTTSYVFTGTGGTVATANVVFFTMLVAGGVSSLAAGDLADRFDRSRLGVTASVLTATLLVATFALVEGSDGLSGSLLFASLVVAFFAVGVAMYGSLPVKNALISGYAEREFSGGLFGVTQTTGALGSATGPALVGYLATEFGVTVAYPMVAVVSLLVAVVFLFLSRNEATTAG
jgi:MFS family permease